MSFFIEYMKLSMKDLFAYRFSFFLFLLIAIMEMAAFVVPFFLIYSVMEGFPGWTLYELFFFSVTNLLSWNITNGFFFSGGTISSVVEDREFDKFLLQPINIFYNMFINGMHLKSTPDILLDITALLVIFPYLGIAFSWINILIYLFLILLSCLTLMGFSYIIASLSFFITNTETLFDIFWIFKGSTDRPVNVYGKNFIVIFFTFILPFALMNYYPVSIFLGKIDYSIIPLLITISLSVLLLGFFCLNYGLKHYKSAG
ncbi:MAG: ABC-2 family transporter protein [Candidatus Nanoarchaeia archaeon]|jgi:ABC-2 type transport system permease protein